MRVRYLQVIALLASTGAVFDATASDQTEVIKALQSLDENQHQGKRSLRAYDMSDLEKNDDTTDEERGIDLKQLDDLIKPDKIQGALDDATKQKALFKEWFKDKDMSAAIYKALSTNGQFLKNKDILIAYGNYMTRLKNDKVLGGWLHTKTLESVLASLQAGNLDKMRRTFGKWYDKKKTAEEVSRLVKAEPDLEKKFRVLLKAYEGFVEKQTRLAKKAADAT
ncbi:hypothetical protein PHYBOEH_008614 [Phytophthora boehmeriae]|uniref:RxLR effector protein n=1 Tax=Phytophthora boehmeriae TaxID=109152 RepID=A0A8T1VZL0_9STRA|nr:hypothetical protein PHYBOEH_008614 [Phytophthora boehmeriae]